MVNFSIIVGNGIGPFTLAPVLFAVFTISKGFDQEFYDQRL